MVDPPASCFIALGSDYAYRNSFKTLWSKQKQLDEKTLFWINLEHIQQSLEHTGA